mgnify:CR=1 FL=1
MTPRSARQGVSTVVDCYAGNEKTRSHTLNRDIDPKYTAHEFWIRQAASKDTTSSENRSRQIPLDETEKPILEVSNLRKTYRLGKLDIEALRGVNLEVKRGELLAIMGASGSGKTTLLNIVGTLDSPTEGSVILDGENLSKLSESDKVRIRRRKIGFIYQFYNLIPILTARENVELPMDIAGVPGEERKERADRLLKMVGLTDRATHKPDELSGGEQQRIAIARALANHPSLVLADEPTGDLDTKTGHEVVGELRDLCKGEGVTVIMVTHDPVAAEHADRIVQMRDGMIKGERVLNP